MPQGFLKPPSAPMQGPPAVPQQSAGAGADLLDAIVQAIAGASGVPHGFDTKASRVGELAGAATPLMAAVKLLSKAPIRAFHGSPHDFDKFDLSKIGTGEGAQAYGHGLYFAENPETAQAYRDALSRPVLKYRGADLQGPVKGRDFLRLTDEQMVDEAARDFIRDARRGTQGDANINDIVEYATGSARVMANADPERRAHWLAAEKRIKDMAQDLMVQEGRMYEVNIHADPETLLDWDKPVSQQSRKIQNIAREVIASDANVLTYDQWVKLPADVRRRRMAEVAVDENDWAVSRARRRVGETGRDLYRAVAGSAEGSPVAGNTLRRRGIPGIKYLDQGSRAAGEGTRNYVMFDDALIEILRKWGLLPAAVAGGAAAQQFSAGGKQ